MRNNSVNRVVFCIEISIVHKLIWFVKDCFMNSIVVMTFDFFPIPAQRMTQRWRKLLKEKVTYLNKLTTLFWNDLEVFV